MKRRPVLQNMLLLVAMHWLQILNNNNLILQITNVDFYLWTFLKRFTKGMHSFPIFLKPTNLYSVGIWTVFKNK